LRVFGWGEEDLGQLLALLRGERLRAGVPIKLVVTGLPVADGEAESPSAFIAFVCHARSMVERLTDLNSMVDNDSYPILRW
jgi:hypothetical protein